MISALPITATHPHHNRTRVQTWPHIQFDGNFPGKHGLASYPFTFLSPLFLKTMMTIFKAVQSINY